MRLNTFVNFGGNCEAAFRFYEQHLGGEITMMMRRAEQPDQPVTWPGWEQSIQYADLLCGPLCHAQRQVRHVVDGPRHEAADSVTPGLPIEGPQCRSALGNPAAIHAPLLRPRIRSRGLAHADGTGSNVSSSRKLPLASR